MYVLCVSLGGFLLGNTGRTGGAESIAEEAEEWEDCDIVFTGDWWDSKQP